MDPLDQWLLCYTTSSLSLPQCFAPELASKRAFGRPCTEGERPDPNVCASKSSAAVLGMEAPRNVRHRPGACNQQLEAIAAMAEVEHS
jgi:hypothetical protein